MAAGDGAGWLPSHPTSARCAPAPEEGVPRVAIGFFGLVTRNLAATLPSLERHVFRVLDAAPLVYEVIVHAMLVLSVADPRSGTLGLGPSNSAPTVNVTVKLDPYSVVRLRPCVFEMEDQGLARHDVVARQKALSQPMPDLWQDGYVSMRNYLVALHSLSRLGRLIAAREAVTGAPFDVVMVLRADTVVLCDVDLPARLHTLLKHAAESARMPPKQRDEGIVVIPMWGRWGGINDRFAYGSRRAMLNGYLGREAVAWEALQHGSHPRNGEKLLRTVLRKVHRVQTRHTSVVVQRFRPTGTGPADIVQMRDDSLEYLRDDLTQVLARKKAQHWYRTAGKVLRNTSAEDVCRLARRAVEHMGTWRADEAVDARSAQKPARAPPARAERGAPLVTAGAPGRAPAPTAARPALPALPAGRLPPCSAMVVPDADVDIQRLVHIPKTGGTSIEASLKKLRKIQTGRILARGAEAARFRSMLKLPPEPCSGREHGWCSTWHTPSQACVPRSFCIVREPYERLLSELHFYLELGWLNRSTCECGAFEAWARSALEREAVQPGAQDCHLVPQWAFARRCAALAPIEALPELFARVMAVKNPIRRLSHHPRCLAPQSCPRVRELVQRAYARDARLHAHVRTLSQTCAAPGTQWAFVGRARGEPDHELARILDGAELSAQPPAARSSSHWLAPTSVDVLSDTRAYDRARAHAANRTSACQRILAQEVGDSMTVRACVRPAR